MFSIAKCFNCKHTFYFTTSAILFSATKEGTVESWILCPKCDKCLFCDRDLTMTDDMLLEAYTNSVLYKRQNCCSSCCIIL